MNAKTVIRRRPEGGLIQAKLAVPQPSEAVVERPRVGREFERLLHERRLLIVSATAGAGKTTAVARAVRRLGHPIAWLTVDVTDGAPGRLVTYLEAAVTSALPSVQGVATRALAEGIPHAEAAGLLAEAIGEHPVAVVLDELERLGDTEEPWLVVEAFLRYAPPAVRTVLISRRPVPVGALRPADETGVIGDAELAFTTTEAAHALAQRGEEEVDAAVAVEATGGWVTGVMFEVWRSAGHVPGAGGEADPLHSYLSAHILGALAPEQREFLGATSLLDEVTAERAQALGLADAGERLAALRAAHLPVVWSADGLSVRYHSRFREYLLEDLERRGPETVRDLRRAHGLLLAREGFDEDAVEELLRAGAPEAALASAQRAILPVIERLDLPVAERWLEALAGAASPAAPELALARLLLAIGGEDYRRAVAIADELAQRGERDRLAGGSDLAAALLAWTYGLAGRLDDFHAVVDAAADGPAVEAIRYAMANLEPGPPRPRPELSGGPLDAVVLAADYAYGRMPELADHEGTRLVDAVAATPRRIGVLRALGKTQEALELYEAALARYGPSVQRDGYVGPEVLTDAGRRDEAYAAVTRARELARASGSPLIEMQAGVAAARAVLRLDRDAAGARAVLDRLERDLGAGRFPLIAEALDTWYGLALLLDGDDEAALVRLRRAVDSMLTGDRVLELPTAAVYLAEAEWRAGDEDAADRAADVALDAARRQGANHVLLQALTDFPAVASRRIDAEREPGSPWHGLGRALLAQGVTVGASIRSAVELHEFGRCEIVVDGREVRPRISKTYELLAYLATRPGRRAERDELLEALFDGRTDESARSYLRQAVRWLRQVLPAQEALTVERGRVQLTDAVAVTTESVRFESLLGEASRLLGEDRLTATLDALAIPDRGEYLPGGRSRWADERRRDLGALASDARFEAAELALAAGRVDDAERLANAVLRADPYREGAWRVLMRVANALGDEDRVIRCYRDCERALAALGTTPAPSTRELLERLRR